MSEEYQGKHEAEYDEAYDLAQETGTPPRISPQTRTRVYVTCLLVDVATLLALGICVILGVLPADKALAIAGLVTTALGLVSSGLAVGYRPTRPGALPSGA